MFTLAQIFPLIITTLVKRYSTFNKAPTALWSLFVTQEVDGLYVDIKVKRYLQLISKDVKLGQKGEYNTQKTQTLKSFYIPPREENSAIDPMTLLNLSGDTDPSRLYSVSEIEALMTKITDGDDNSGYVGTDIRVEKLKRAFERMCAQLLFTRKLTFVNHDQIDFFPKPESFVNAVANGGSWDLPASIIKESIAKAIDFIAKKGDFFGGNRYQMIGRGSDISLLYANEQIQKELQYRDDASFNKLGMAYLEVTRDSFAKYYVGTIQVNGKIVDLFAYDAYYELEDETQVMYVPENEVLILPVNASSGAYASDMRFVYGATKVKNKALDIWTTKKGSMTVQMKADDQAETNVSVIRSAGIPLTASVDKFATITVRGA